MTREDINDIINVICPNDEDFEKACISPAYLKKELEVLALEQQSCEDCISRDEAIRAAEQGQIQGYEWQFKKLCNLPSAISQQKMGQWILTQRGKYIDINCSECGNTRIKGCAYGYTIDELNLEEVNDFIAKNRINYCECCGAKMEGMRK